MNKRLERRLGSLAGAGTFWSRNMEETEQVPFMRALTRLSFSRSSAGMLRQVTDATVGAPETLLENVVWRFGPSDIVVLGPDLDDRDVTVTVDSGGQSYVAIARTDGSLTGWSPLFLTQDPNSMQAITTEGGEFILWPVSTPVPDAATETIESRRHSYIVPIPRGMTPTVIAAQDEDLALGTGFRAGDGFLVFPRPPLGLFPDRRIVARSAWMKVGRLNSYMWGVDL